MAGFLSTLRFRWRRRLKPRGMYVPAAFGLRLEDRCFLCFFAGLLAGTVMANFWYPSFADEAGYYLGLLDRNVNLGQGERVQLFGQVLRQRMVEVWIAWLIGMTAYSVWLFYFLTAGFGFSMGFVLSVITVQKGLMGLPVFLVTVMPQALCYLPLWCILLLWGMQKERRFRIPAFLLLLFLTAAGSACEAWINPVLLKMFNS
ncbi:stage II sporulation protein M [Clostridium sp. Marseille-P2415]|uniref:stage II sporulation protein M n=1 Tax=Clostridium sp. Marseille-P2415 TaxID=1805471 RepID=UPI0011154A1B|nr:stage II sporulation protein M [Clostridium sp. Marseille-P2415]